MKKTINNFLKEISINNFKGQKIKHKIFDFDKMYQDDAFYFILISERGRLGKTYGAKELGQKLYLENGYPYVYLKNLNLQIKKEGKKFLKQVNDLDIFADFSSDKQGVYKQEGREKNYSCFFHSLNGAEKDKGSRTEANIVIYDEFLDGTKHLEDSPTFLLKSILDTYDNPVNPFEKKLKKCFILGNFKTLNSRLLIDLGVFKLEKQLTTLYDSKGKAFVRILAPQYSKKERKEIKEELSGDPIFEFGNTTKQNDYSLFNQNVRDIVNNVVLISNTELEENYNLKLILYFFKQHTHNYIFMLSNRFKKHYHILTNNQYKGDEQVYNLDKKSLREEIPTLSRDVKKDLIYLLECGKITFADIYSREMFIEGILK